MQNFKTFIIAAAGVALVAGCSPTVKVEAPDKPIEINMNIKIDQEVRVKVDKDLDAAIANDPALFGSAAAGATKQEEGKKP
ncbi:MAG: YnbE family lipoprotein [Alphaproteobacteria bacterium]|nr:MAG: YnbE family lipoprotein [Alphaproteobacteria bacterium]